MKKIFTLLLAAGSITFASAQSGQKANPFKDSKNNSHDVSFGQARQQTGYDNRNTSYGDYSFSAREKDAQIQKINREFAQKIAAVQKDRRMKTKQKTQQVRMLEKQRDDQIKQVQLRFANNKNRFGDKGYARNDNRKW